MLKIIYYFIVEINLQQPLYFSNQCKYNGKIQQMQKYQEKE